MYYNILSASPEICEAFWVPSKVIVSVAVMTVAASEDINGSTKAPFAASVAPSRQQVWTDFEFFVRFDILQYSLERG